MASIIVPVGMSFHTKTHSWGTVVYRDDTGGRVAVYRAKNPRIASYLARVEHSRDRPARAWEDTALVFGLPIAMAILTLLFWNDIPLFPPLVLGAGLGAVTVLVARQVAAKATTARRLDQNRAITALLATANDELIEAAIDAIIAFDEDPQGTLPLIAELDSAWRAAAGSAAHEKSSVIQALRDTAAHFPTTAAEVHKVRIELRTLRRSLASLDAAKRELDEATSTADLADPSASTEALRLVAMGLDEDAAVLREVAKEQRQL